MDLATFRGLLEEHGPELDRWPGELLDAALALLSADEAAQAAFAAATAAQISDAGGPEDVTPAVGRIMAAIRKG